MLEAKEFEYYSSVHMKVIESIKEYRKKHGVSLKEVPLAELRAPALKAYEELTGYKPDHFEFDHIWHHQVQRYEKNKPT